ncbi:MAG TPA: hypothetical protein VHN99_10865, partial [Deinococcales bacterium]|nr:hypothetical protein [Deinococcales bacterium]
MATTALPVSGARRTLKDNLTLSAFWFGSSAHWALLLVVMIPSDVRRLVGKADSPVYLGVLLGWFALVALILPPFIGALSDRVGRRRP